VPFASLQTATVQFTSTFGDPDQVYPSRVFDALQGTRLFGGISNTRGHGKTSGIGGVVGAGGGFTTAFGDIERKNPPGIWRTRPSGVAVRFSIKPLATTADPSTATPARSTSRPRGRWYFTALSASWNFNDSKDTSFKSVALAIVANREMPSSVAVLNLVLKVLPVDKAMWHQTRQMPRLDAKDSSRL
jgi:hypothetical protein